MGELESATLQEVRGYNMSIHGGEFQDFDVSHELKTTQHKALEYEEADISDEICAIDKTPDMFGQGGVMSDESSEEFFGSLETYTNSGSEGFMIGYYPDVGIEVQSCFIGKASRSETEVTKCRGIIFQELDDAIE